MTTVPTTNDRTGTVPWGAGAVDRLRFHGRNLRYRGLFALLRTHLRGDVLDVGGGTLVDVARARGVDFRRWVVVEPNAVDLPTCDDPRVEARVGDGLALDIPDGMFDRVLSVHVLEHVLEPLRMLDELHRVVRPGGLLVVVVPQTANLHHAPHHYQNFTRYWLEAAAQRLDAEVVEYRALGGAWSTIASRLLLHLPAALGVPGYAVSERGRGPLFWTLFPLGLLLSAVVVPLALLLSSADMPEEANNHVVVLRRRRPLR